MKLTHFRQLIDDFCSLFSVVCFIEMLWSKITHWVKSAFVAKKQLLLHSAIADNYVWVYDRVSHIMAIKYPGDSLGTIGIYSGCTDVRSSIFMLQRLFWKFPREVTLCVICNLSVRTVLLLCRQSVVPGNRKRWIQALILVCYGSVTELLRVRTITDGTSRNIWGLSEIDLLWVVGGLL